ncbi:MAG: cytochrome P450 [Gordonia sp. (in: high G+C Gram-positive bacteria)]|uniref:cytochrome P450 n=1 Tax=Gordonia sp. (in: high G+C Gram-positive bacteria) TaxID=84139 RepID=UPI003BB76C15
MTAGPAERQTAIDRLEHWRDGPRRQRLHGLPAGPRLPELVQTLGLWTARPQFLRWAHSRYGDVFTVRDAPVGQAVVLCNADHVQQVLRGDPEIFRAGEGNAALRPIVGRRSVITLDEPAHRSARRRMTPAFHGDRVAPMVATMSDLAAREVSTWPVGQDFALLHRTQKLSMDFIVGIVLGVEGARAAQFGDAVRHAMPLDARDMSLWLWPGLGRYWPWRRTIANMDRADQILYDEIAARRRDPFRAQRADVLSMLLDGDQDDDELVRDELVTLLMTGHETTAVAIAWMFERLLRHPDALDRVLSGLDDPSDPYRDAVIKETLRLRPAIHNLMRRISKPLEVAGYHLPEGTILMPAIGVLHTDERFWGEDAGMFRPERWLETTAANPAWVPFGGGARRCLGAIFAHTEMSVVLRTVLRMVELQPDRSGDETPKMHHAVVIPSRGARIRVIRRLA